MKTTPQIQPPPIVPPPPPEIRVVNLLPAAMAVLFVIVLMNFLGTVTASLLAITMAVLLASALNPIVLFFQRWMQRTPAALLTVALLVAALIGMVLAVLPPVVEQITTFIQEIPGFVQQIQGTLVRLIERFPELGQWIGPEQLAQLPSQAAAWLAGSAGSIFTLSSALVGSVFTGVVTMVMVVFVLIAPAPLIGGVLGAFPPKNRLAATRALAQILVRMGAWGRVTLLMMLITGVITAAGLYFLGVENWLVFGILSALGELIPNIGPIVAAAVPLMLGGAGKLHPLSITIGVLVFGSVFGLAGAFLTVPLLIVIKAIYENFYLTDRPEISDEIAQALIRGDVGEDMAKEEEKAELLKEQREKNRQAEGEKSLSLGDVEEMLGAEEEPQKGP